MPVVTSLALAVSLSMDSFAAALGKGAVLRRPCIPDALRVGAAFGTCQLLMPIIGWAVGVAFAGLVAAVDHWIAFSLLLLVGGAMIRNFLRPSRDREINVNAGRLALATAALATSIDAAAVGIGLAMAHVDIVTTALLIGVVTFGMAFGGVLIGRAAGPLLGRWAELVGGLGLIAIGSKILLDHTVL